MEGEHQQSPADLVWLASDQALIPAPKPYIDHGRLPWEAPAPRNATAQPRARHLESRDRIGKVPPRLAFPAYLDAGPEPFFSVPRMAVL
jgi:hypothetical protein